MTKAPDPADFSLPSAEELLADQLPTELQSQIDDYNTSVGSRDNYVWKWCYNVFPNFRLSTVPEQHHETVRRLKVLYSIYITTVDDLAERPGGAATYREAKKIPHPTSHPRIELEAVDEEVIQYLIQLWSEFESRLTTAPRYEEFKRQFWFDLKQSHAGMDYSQLIDGQPDIANLAEGWRFLPQNMILYGLVNIDLMHSPTFERDDLRHLRSFLETAQDLVRIGNCVSTWPREVPENDYSSMVLIKLIETTDLTEEALTNRSVDEVQQLVRDHNIEETLLDTWQQRWEELDRFLQAKEVQSVDLNEFLQGMTTTLRYLLASRGHK